MRITGIAVLCFALVACGSEASPSAEDVAADAAADEAAEMAFALSQSESESGANDAEANAAAEAAEDAADAADAALVAANEAVEAAAAVEAEAVGLSYEDYPCTVDCSGHEAGYQWAQENGVDDSDNCGGNSQSFIEGCQAYASEQ